MARVRSREKAQASGAWADLAVLCFSRLWTAVKTPVETELTFKGLVRVGTGRDQKSAGTGPGVPGTS